MHLAPEANDTVGFALVYHVESFDGVTGCINSRIPEDFGLLNTEALSSFDVNGEDVSDKRQHRVYVTEEESGSNGRNIFYDFSNDAYVLNHLDHRFCLKVEDIK